MYSIGVVPSASKFPATVNVATAVLSDSSLSNTFPVAATSSVVVSVSAVVSVSTGVTSISSVLVSPVFVV